MSHTEPRRGRTRRLRRTVAVVAGAVVGLAGGWAAAATLGAGGGVVDAGSAVVKPGCTGSPSVNGVMTSFTETDGYWVDTVSVGSVGGNCRAPGTYVAGLADDSIGFPLIGEWEGTAPSGGSADLSADTITSGAPVDSITSAGNTVRVFYITETP